jgi:membrane-associated PAP2 superfamily phosphatase
MPLTAPAKPLDSPARTAPPVARWLLLLLAFTLLWDLSGADLSVMQRLGTASGFALQNQWFLKQVMHGAWRQAFVGLYGLMAIWALWPSRWSLSRLTPLLLPRRERLTLLLLVALSLLAVNLLKTSSHTSCPWDLQMFGGSARYVSHWSLWQGSDGGSGRCFPGGHASSGFAFLGLCLPWLLPPPGTRRAPAAGWWWLTALLLAGLIAGTVQTLRGAHYPSHTLWTLLICGAVSWAGWRLASPRLAQTG